MMSERAGKEYTAGWIDVIKHHEYEINIRSINSEDLKLQQENQKNTR